MSKDTSLFRVKIQTVYVVLTNTDLTEGRGMDVRLAYAETMALAKDLGRGKYVMGSDCPVEPINGVVIEDENNKAWAVDRNLLGKFYRISDDPRAKRREELLRQLSPEDLEILGVRL
jgi:hypothetical protein